MNPVPSLPAIPRKGEVLLRALGGGAARLALLVMLLVAAAVPAVAREEIRSFVSDTILRADGSVAVVETITVNVEGREIRRGIYRDIPTQLINPDNSRLRSDLRVVEVLRNGRTEPYRVQNIGGGFKRIMIGDEDVFIDHGQQTYTIRYTMSRMARFFEANDELFWNATGNYWVFPIVSATATISLPPGATITDTVAFTGPPGSTEQAATIEARADNSVIVRTTRELRAGEGLSVAVQFPKGVVLPAEGMAEFGHWLSDHRELVFPVFAVAIVLLYSYFAWSAVGRDPVRGTIIPLFHPPKGMSPSLVHYIGNMGFKQNGWIAFISAIFDLGVRGHLQIDKAGKDMTITSTGKELAERLPPGEFALLEFVRDKGSVTIDKTDGPKLNEKRAELVKAIERENREVYFKNNALYSAGGLVLALAMLGALVWLEVLDPMFLLVAVVAAIVIGVLFGTVFASGRGIGARIVSAIWLVIVGINLMGSGFAGLSGLRLDNGFIAALSIVTIVIIFAILMRAPTVQGRKIMDQLEGFKMYLDTAEKNRLNYVDKGEPKMTVKRFESILPFAIALGVEKPWSERFEADLARNAVADASGGSYSPGWYSGSSWRAGSSSGDFSRSFSAMATSMSAAMIAAQPSSSSGSGFSGGGGSGGGGGGGGGGGW